MWTYKQSNGSLSCDGTPVTVGYSGHASGRNCPALQDSICSGPIPRGRWHINLAPFNSPEHGPFVLRLTPAEGTETFGRGGFLIHGDSITHPGEASLGCICIPRVAREMIAKKGCTDLEVIE